MNYKKIFSNKFVILTTTTYLILGIGLYTFIPNQMINNATEQSINKSKIILDTLTKSRDFYINNTDITFHNESFIHSLSSAINSNSIKIDLYSNYPFKNHERKLNSTQINLLHNINTKNEQILIDKKNNKITVARTDYLTSKKCVNCHNNNVGRNWDEDWKLGDARGIMELTTTINPNILQNITYTKIMIVVLFIIIILISVLYVGYNILKIEKKSIDKNLDLSKQFDLSFNELNRINTQLEHNLNHMYDNFSKYVIYSKTDLFGIITEVSDAFCTMAGYTREEMIGKNHNIVRHPDMSASTFKGMWGTIEKNKIWTGEVKNLKKDGGYYWVDAVVSPNYDANGSKIGYISIRQDITEAKDKESILKSQGKSE